MKTYHITRWGDSMTDKVVVTVHEDSRIRNLSPRPSQKQRNHSPDGFNFGYGGSGPAQLALAILMDYTGSVPRPAMYQAFKFQFLSGMKDPGGTITAEQIQQFIDEFDEGDKFMPPGEKP